MTDLRKVLERLEKHMAESWGHTTFATMALAYCAVRREMREEGYPAVIDCSKLTAPPPPGPMYCQCPAAKECEPGEHDFSYAEMVCRKCKAWKKTE